MQDVCWIHNKYYRFGEQCPDCLKKEQEYKQSLVAVDEEVPPSARKREPGDRLWGVIKALLFFIVALWVMLILGAMLMTGSN